MTNFRCITLMKKASLVIILMTLTLPLLGACGKPAEVRTITIGYLQGSMPLSPLPDDVIIEEAFDDLIKYYNDNNLIPGVRLEPIPYWGMEAPQRNISCYEQLKESGVDVIFTSSADIAQFLSPVVNEDKMVLFTTETIDEDKLQPPGYVFCIGSTPRQEAYTLLKWVAENDTDFPSGRLAKLGAAVCDDSYGRSFLAGLEEYAAVHPDQYEWVTGYLDDGHKCNWSTEVGALKDCDYVVPTYHHCTQQCGYAGFAAEYRESAYTAKFIGTDKHLSDIKYSWSPEEWNVWNGTLLIRSSQWWNEESDIVDLTKTLLAENHPLAEGNYTKDLYLYSYEYLSVAKVYVMLEIIKDAVASSGPEGFNSDALYEAARSFSLSIDGVERYSFNGTKRTAVNYVGVYEVKADEKDIFRVDPDWYPVVSEP